MRDYQAIMRRARHVAKTFGHYRAAKYLRNQNIPFREGYLMIFGRKARANHF